MEILMKLKCSPAATSRSPHSTIKVVDQHQQLQQQHIVGHASHMQPPHSATSSSLHGTSMPQPTPPPLSHRMVTQEVMLPTCLEYASTMDCCSAAQQDIVDLQWEPSGNSSGGGVGGGGGSMTRSRNIQLPGREHCTDFMPSIYTSHTQQSSSSPMNMNCCGLFEPACCNGMPYRTGSLLPLTSTAPQAPMQPFHVSNQINTDEYNNSFSYQEPDENFISIDDAKIKGFLLKIGEKEEQKRRNKAAAEKMMKCQEPVIYEIIELDDEEPSVTQPSKIPTPAPVTTPVPATTPVRTTTPAPSKTPLPVIMPARATTPAPAKTPAPARIPTPLKTTSPAPVPPRTKTPQIPAPKETRIVASIDLLDSSSESDQSEVDEEEELPLAAAAAVSCELECDGSDAKVDEYEREVAEIPQTQDNDVVVLNSDDEENEDFIDEQEEGVELRWDDLEDVRERTFFECYLCGKKVQSSYNLRRHMMIHTGERPFGCDMCERRFREFSDLKKHRRRHINAPNFVCMICRINKPTEQDPTRCAGCDSKNAAALAAMRPQMNSSPEKSQTPPVVAKSTHPKLSTSKPPSRNLTPAPTPPPACKTPTKIVTSQPPPPPPPPPTVLPPLTPIGNLSTTTNSDIELMLDNVPAVHRPSSNQQGVATRKEFPCPLCQRPFGTRHNLKRHFMIHTGEKPFSCPKCRKPFREYSTLKKHLVTHKRDRWYKCHQCAHKSRDYLIYMEHKTTHPETSEDSYSPSKKRSKSKHSSHEDSYDSNEDDSSSEDWLECCECGQRFTDIEAYTEHLKEHDPTVFLYECYICKQTFAERPLLVKHMAEHDTDKVLLSEQATELIEDNNDELKVLKVQVMKGKCEE